jgi:hypothetical protein
LAWADEVDPSVPRYWFTQFGFTLGHHISIFNFLFKNFSWFQILIFYIMNEYSFISMEYFNSVAELYKGKKTNHAC